MTALEIAPAVLGERLREARRARGLSQEEVADELGVSRPTLVAMEQGKRRPRPEELVTLARIYGRQVHELARQTPPVLGLAALFRAAEKGATAEMAESVEELQRTADSLVELETITGAPSARNYPDQYDIKGIPLDAAAEQLADVERRRLGYGDGPLPWLRDVLEDEIGLRIFALPLPASIAGLFGHAEPAGSCVAINSRHPRERQQWTLAHEYAHFLTSRWSTEVTALTQARSSARERFADSFAAHFLMPRGGIVRRFQAARNSRGGDFTAGDLLQIAAAYLVSAEALALRLEDLRLVGAAWWDGLRARGLKVEQGRKLLGLPSAGRDQELLPRRARYLAVEAYLKAEISEGQLARLLGTDRAAARRIARDLSASLDLDDAGGLVAYEWNPEGSAGDPVAAK
ncbi:MAG TPA: XRE family transcriptional regulator [Mycobacteriales bacterium]|nr:XRE family transcriptional regulator [Mycobacteriales bacterium]